MHIKQYEYLYKLLGIRHSLRMKSFNRNPVTIIVHVSGKIYSNIRKMKVWRSEFISDTSGLN